MKQSVIGILAHVDAGKTTLSESMLYHAGNIRKIGRVDHGDAFLDYNSQEKKRGITIFAKQAVFKWKECHFTLIDTPGHIDFSAEMERILQVLDYAIVLINGMDGVQIHTETIWSLLKHYQIPAFVFVNKMDASYLDKKALMKEINQQLSDACIDFTSEERFETAALCDETLLNEYMETDQICDESFARAVAERKIFPCFWFSFKKQRN